MLAENPIGLIATTPHVLRKGSHEILKHNNYFEKGNLFKNCHD